MTFKAYIKDRFVLICCWFLALVVSLLVVYLDANVGMSFVRQSSLIYAFVLGIFIIGLGIIGDFIRMREWYREVRHALNHEDDKAFILCLQHPVSEEQRMMHELAERQYSVFMNEILLMKQQREKHVHFTNQWVHHMKTPVSVLHLLTQQMQGNHDSPELEQLKKSVAEENERLTAGLEMMLSTARLEKFEMDLHVSRISVHTIIRQVINQHKKSLIRHRIFPKINGEDVNVESDEKWLQFILTQLVTNAIKYSRDKEGTKSLVFDVSATPREVYVHVRDEGMGIAEHDLPRVFEPFFTGANGRKEGDATGMGLYLVKEVCRKLGHSIQLESEVGKGTTASIRFSTKVLHDQLL